MSPTTFRKIILASSVLALVLSFNLIAGAQDQTTTTKQTDKSQQGTTKQKTNTQNMQNGQDMNKGAQSGTTSAGMLSNDDRRFIMEAAHGGMMEVDLGKVAAQKGMSDEVKQFGQRMVDDHTKANDELMQLASSKGVMINHSMAMGAGATGSNTQMSSSDTRMTDQASGSSAKQTSGSTTTQASGSNTTQTSGSNTMSGQGQNSSNASGDDAKMMKKHQEMMGKMSALSGAEFDRKYMDQMVKDHEKTVSLFERESTKGSDAEVKAWAAKTLPALREHLRMARDIESRVKGGAKGDTKSGTSSGSRTN
jgi:putative membrane protein